MRSVPRYTALTTCRSIWEDMSGSSMIVYLLYLAAIDDMLNVAIYVQSYWYLFKIKKIYVESVPVPSYYRYYILQYI